jgi:MFS transporter, DHA1 family, tetracycline resistance protein
VAILLNFVAVLSFTLLNQTFRFFTNDSFGMTPKQTGLVLAFIGLCGVLVQGAVIRPLSKRKVAEAKSVRAGIALQIIGFATLVFAPTLGVWSLYLAGVLLAAAYISNRTPDAEQGSTLGTSQSLASLARTIAPILGGFLYGQFGPRTPYAFAVLGMVLALVLAFQLVVNVQTTSASRSI